MRTRPSSLLVVYLVVAVVLTWPMALRPGELVVGGEHSDIWNSLWSLWYFVHSIFSGEWPVYTQLLGHPDGGTIAVADPVNGLFGLVALPVLGVVKAYNLLVVAHLVFSGWAAHRLAESLGQSRWGRWSSWIAGLGYMTAPVLVSAVHNGTSEALAGGWLPLAVLACLVALRRGGVRASSLAILALAVAAWASWYGGLCAFLCCLCLLALGERDQSWSQRWRRLAPVLVLAAVLVAPLALAQQSAATALDSLVGIKNAAELSMVRRTTGSADPLGWFMPGDFRSPDFRHLSRYSEDFIHCHYLGWVALIGGLLAMIEARRREGLGWLVLAGSAAAVLAMGPVLVRDGCAWLLPGDRVIPLPYLLLERLPGFSSLSLLFRLAQLSSLCLLLVAARGFALRGRRPALLVGGVLAALLIENRLLAPVSGLPDTSDARQPGPILQLAGEPAGGVMNFPVAGGRRYLFEQTAHGQPLAGGLNFPNNSASREVWQEILRIAQGSHGDSLDSAAELRRVGCAPEILYLVVHEDHGIRPDMHDRAVAILDGKVPVLAAAPGLRILQLCTASPRSR